MSDSDGPDASADGGTAPSAAPTALPSVGARVLAFVAIVLAGAAGAFIGYGVAQLQCTGDDCAAITGLGGLFGAVVAAGGTAVVAVLTLRAMGEWHTIQARGGPGPGLDEKGRRRPPTAPSGPPPRVR
ncbi:MAG: hypothetical protein MUE36_15190 [Acidimicrobiales bacterium]|nr:hypothetical protein [Acidimicrobiales bacterium]